LVISKEKGRLPDVEGLTIEKRIGLNERQIERQIDTILFYRSKGEMVGLEYAERYKIAERTARADLSKLVEKSLLYKQGETKSVKYRFNAE
jgi:predicted HTH transcriptional regulator